MTSPASSPPFVPPPPSLVIAQLSEAVKWQCVATLASAIITASGRPYSIEQALEIAQDIRFALYPEPQAGSYKEWEKTKDERLRKIRI